MTNVQEVRLRPFARADLESVIAAEQECFPADAWSQAVFDNLLAAGARGVVAERAGEMVGFIFYVQCTQCVYVADVAVLPRAQRTGLGRRLMDDAFSFARSSGLDTVALEVEVDNEPALELYRNMGFQEVRRINGYYAPGRDAFAMNATVSALPRSSRLVENLRA